MGNFAEWSFFLTSSVYRLVPPFRRQTPQLCSLRQRQSSFASILVSPCAGAPHLFIFYCSRLYCHSGICQAGMSRGRQVSTCACTQGEPFRRAVLADSLCTKPFFGTMTTTFFVSVRYCPLLAKQGVRPCPTMTANRLCRGHPNALMHRHKKARDAHLSSQTCVRANTVPVE